MNIRPTNRVVWLVIPLVPVAMMCGLMLLTGGPDQVDPATRGAKAPVMKKFSLSDPRSWDESTVWLGDGLDSLMDWKYNPWRRESDYPGERLEKLRQSDRPEDREEYERLMQQGREWHERILARYPELADKQDREMSREENGYRQWTELVKRVRDEQGDSMFSTKISWDMEGSLRRGTPLDAKETKAWVDSNRARIDEIRAIGLLPGQSAAGVTDSDREGSSGFSWQATDALMLDVSASMADGDSTRALESIRALNGLADHQSNIGPATMSNLLVAERMRLQMQSHVMAHIFPTLPEDQRAAWQEALNPTLQQPADFADALRGEWNLSMRHNLLPLLSDDKDPGTPRDGDHLAEAYTRHMQGLAQEADGMTLRDYAGSFQETAPVTSLSKQSNYLAQDMGMTTEYDVRRSFVVYQEQTGLTQAAFAIMNGQEIPLDPVYGLPYKWDPVKRELRLPDPPGGRKWRIRPMKVP
ncbi:MAG: hypothetical protein EOP85_00445 [Verrucomicrobiaceae bacterium]|nr:MAG: hypothetical protein EOP85_00445 [Verrucomicrobiaceae bacterium]